MDELELLKNDWKKRENEFPKVSYNEIYKMILKKSSSIVRWIFIISILEFILWATIDIALRFNEKYSKLTLKLNQDFDSFFMFTSVLSYCVLFYFIIRFYFNYRKIKTTDSVKILMCNILRSRKTVKYYIWVNLSFFALISFITIGYQVNFKEQLILEKGAIYLIIIVAIVLVILSISVIALFYRLIYGFLTRKLKKNYEELERLEI